MDRIDWEILEAVSNEFESLTQIYPMVNEALDVERVDIIDRMESLLQRGLIKLSKNIEFNKETLLDEPDVYYDTEFWFGLTEQGAEAWEQHAKEFDGFDVDWSEAWTASYNYEKQSGHIYGVNEEVCMKVLKNEKEAIIDFDSLMVEQVSSFQAKYYKKITGGVKITFTVERPNK